MKKKLERRATGAKKGRRTLAHPVEFRLRTVRLFLKEGYSARRIADVLKRFFLMRASPGTIPLGSCSGTRMGTTTTVSLGLGSVITDVWLSVKTVSSPH